VHLRRGRTSGLLPTLALCCLTLTACGGGSDSGTDSAGPAAGGSASGGATVAGVQITADPALHDALPDEITSSGTLKVATDVPYAPFEFFANGEGSGEIAGLDPDIGHAIGAKLGVELEFQKAVFDSIIPAMAAGKYDLVMSAMTDNKERQKTLDFVDYDASGSGIMVKKGNPDKITTLADLCGKTVAVERGTKQVLLVQEAAKKCSGGTITVLQVPKDSDAQLAIKAGKAVADVLDKPTAAYTAKTIANGSVFEVPDDPAFPEGYGPSPTGIGVKKGRDQLVTALQKALQSLMDDGTYKKILDKYGVGGTAIPKATVNAAVD
jgi:polar amino acid transport system substrate-binding protein